MGSLGKEVEAADGLEALSHLQGDVDFDVMLLDLLMPKLPGLGVLERVRKTVRTAGLPVVVITASRDEAHKREILAAGADDYLEKPIDPAKIASRVKALLRRSMATTPFTVCGMSVAPSVSRSQDVEDSSPRSRTQSPGTSPSRSVRSATTRSSQPSRSTSATISS